MCRGDRSKGFGASSLIKAPVNSCQEDGGEVVEHRLLVRHQGEQSTDASDRKTFLTALTWIERELRNKSLAETKSPVFHLNLPSRVCGQVSQPALPLGGVALALVQVVEEEGKPSLPQGSQVLVDVA